VDRAKNVASALAGWEYSGESMASATEPAACAANIGPRGRQQRMRVGLVGVAVSALATLVLLASAAPVWLVALVVIPWWVSGLGIFQAREQTCVALAARGQRDLDGGPEPLPGPEHESIRRQARRVHAQALGFAVALTALSLLLRSILA
jgi:hypothetical protein